MFKDMKKLIITLAIIITGLSANAITITSGKTKVTLTKKQITYLRTLNRISINSVLDAGINVRNHDYGDFIIKVLRNYKLDVLKGGV